ncbi:MAG: 50S ribosome-binding GTPase [Desulfobacteraceae bacterium]|nr:50S ribosome-binding GTPase [Desulfobacteraceae bacterium]MDH3574348.1 50S ribosome-binding GTPase [Desulfobacteraceae bacterium]MDH3722283.1 50S ribosome-binding GTPase [Desulfobacteraceae bacterium]MDH3838280.1 50S ribosome-binding GTPase [Desulfobacteraceae bacterium]MDH3873197.1 50S ribosome-binding GTPase [Desulfobacteraceae bacterium]
MATNLPPEYYEADKRYRAAKTPGEKISCIEELLRIVPKHKGTDKLRAGLRKRLSKLKTTAQAKKGTGKRESAFRIEKEGAGQVVLVGPANVGKSALVSALTNATPEIANFPHTTWKPTPGMMPMENIQIQLVDTPPLNRNFMEPELLDLIRRSDYILVVVDLHTDPVHQLEDSIAILQEHRIMPDHLKKLYSEQRGLIFIPFLVLTNKFDDENFDENFEIFSELLENEWPSIPVSATTGRNLEQFKMMLFEQLEIIRVYSKAPGKEPDYKEPFILKKGDTVEDFARKVHQDFASKLKTARLWGTAVYDGQLVQRDHVLSDSDILELQI